MLNDYLNTFNLKTKRFYLKSLNLKDVNSNYLSWFNNNHLKYIETKDNIKTIVNLKKYVKDNTNNKNIIFLGIFEKYSNLHIGNGVGREVIFASCKKLRKEKQIKEFLLGVKKENLQALKLYKKIGFIKYHTNFSNKSIKMRWVLLN